MATKAANVTKIDIPTQAFWKKVSDALCRSRTITTEFRVRGFGLRLRHRRTETITQVEKPNERR
jgi:hypothetical protein